MVDLNDEFSPGELSYSLSGQLLPLVALLTTSINSRETEAEWCYWLLGPNITLQGT